MTTRVLARFWRFVGMVHDSRDLAARRRRPRRRQRKGGLRPSVSRTVSRSLLALAALYLAAILIVPALVPPPDPVGLAGTPRPLEDARYLVDDSWLDAEGNRRLEQTIFDEVLATIAGARHLVHLDLFLFNDWQGPILENNRALADELTAALVAARVARPELSVVLVTDPINTVYGGLPSPRLERLRAAGVEVVLTDLVPLQDSNRLWSGFWRWFVRPFGNAPGGHLPNPLGPGRVTARSWLALANFKANHRKLVVADDGAGGWRAIVTSANPHDGSSAHRNTALAFGGAAALDLLAAERALLALCGADAALARLDAALAAAPRPAAGRAGAPAARAGQGAAETPGATPGAATVQVLGERRIEEAALALIGRAGRGDRIDLAMFYLADRDVVGALVDASGRGARVRALLDINADAFGRAKNGVPNRPVAAELVRAGVAVRWCATRGEQCHAKQLYVGSGARHALLLGSGNFTRRNLHDLNLETDVRVEMMAGTPLAIEARAHFDKLWNNTDGRTYSVDYGTHADESAWLRLQYRSMEATGLSTF